MPLSTDPDVGIYVTQAECHAYVDQLAHAVESLRDRIDRLQTNDPVTLELQSSYTRFADQVRGYAHDVSCWWGSDTDLAIEYARTFNQFEARYVDVVAGATTDAPWNPSTPDTPLSTKATHWLVGILVGGAFLGALYLTYRWYAAALPVPKRRRKQLGAVRVKGPDGGSRYNLEIER